MGPIYSVHFLCTVLIPSVPEIPYMVKPFFVSTYFRRNEVVPQSQLTKNWFAGGGLNSEVTILLQIRPRFARPGCASRGPL